MKFQIHPVVFEELHLFHLFAGRGDGGLHGLDRKDFDNYYSYSEAKKEIENGQFFTPPDLCQLVTEALKPSQSRMPRGFNNSFAF